MRPTPSVDIHPALPLRFIAPAAPVQRTTPPEGPGYSHEVKHDGWRLQIHKDGFDITLYSKSGFELSRKRFRLLYEAAMALKPRRAIIDCELVAIDDEGRSDFTALMRGERHRLRAWCFDLLVCNDQDYRPLPLKTRRRKLMTILARTPQELFRFSETFDDPLTLLAAAQEMELEGIVSKRLDQPYVSGRNDGWVKVKTAAWKDANRERFRHFKR